VSKGERTRQRLLEAAIQRFATDGYRRTSVSDIARDAGLTPAATYAYFPNKDALFRAAVDEDAAALIEQAVPAPEGSLRDRWLSVPVRLREALPRHPLARRVLGAQEPEVIPQLLELPSLAELRKRLADDLADAQNNGDVRPDADPDQLAMGMESIVLALLMAGIHAPVDSARDAGVFAVLDAATRPAGEMVSPSPGRKRARRKNAR
jgi:AcrR family transcriptional regulator